MVASMAKTQTRRGVTLNRAVYERAKAHCAARANGTPFPLSGLVETLLVGYLRAAEAGGPMPSAADVDADVRGQRNGRAAMPAHADVPPAHLVVGGADDPAARGRALQARLADLEEALRTTVGETRELLEAEREEVLERLRAIRDLARLRQEARHRAFRGES